LKLQLAETHQCNTVRYIAGKEAFIHQRGLAGSEHRQSDVHDAVFAPRFRARALLREHGLPVPFDFPGGVYELSVQLAWAQRTLLLRSENTLEDLHFGIQAAFDWDADHLYCFFMNGQDVFDDYRIASPPEDEGPYWAHQVRIGELGLVPGHRFIYYFDYGDGHRFDIAVTNICLVAKPDKYPKVTESVGEPPEQYPDWESQEP
jgi:hypothetical protein